jgi:hypothetical protein
MDLCHTPGSKVKIYKRDSKSAGGSIVSN